MPTRYYVNLISIKNLKTDVWLSSNCPISQSINPQFLTLDPSLEPYPAKLSTLPPSDGYLNTLPMTQLLSTFISITPAGAGSYAISDSLKSSPGSLTLNNGIPLMS